MHYDLARRIALRAHAEQLDKTGRAYLGHALAAAAAAARESGEDNDAMVVAVLHDIISTNGIDLMELRAAGLTERQAAALDALMRRPREHHADFVKRWAANPIARLVERIDVGQRVQSQAVTTTPHPKAPPTPRPRRSARSGQASAGRGRPGASIR